MSKRRKRGSGKRRGHYCWCCRSILANERFGGKGHRQHLCKKCQRLPAEEREFRSEANNLERCITWEGIIPRKRRRQFERFLTHPNARIRSLAEQMKKEDETTRRQNRGEFEAWETGELTGDVNLDFDIAAAYPLR